MTRAVCFILMPFGRKADAAGRVIDFDAVYRDIFAPAVDDAGLLCVRADEESGAGLIHKLMYERLLLSEYAIADLTIANANVYYELGIRHVARPASTVMVMADDTRLPFDVQGLRAFPYRLGPDGAAHDATGDRARLAERLIRCQNERETDSPLYQLVGGLKPLPIEHERTDVFRERARYAQKAKADLAAARKASLPLAALDAVANELGEARRLEAGVAIDLMLSYRAVGAWDKVVATAETMDPAIARTVLVREQRAMAMNRMGRGAEAATELGAIIKAHGASSETYGLLGRVHKDAWDKAHKAGQAAEARGHLKRAIAAYLAGFEADWRDAYPGVNAVTLMSLADPPDPRREALVPVVAYAVRRRIAQGGGDYWDHATLFELAIIALDADMAAEAFADMTACAHEGWMRETTLRNASLLLASAKRAGADIATLEKLADELAAVGA
jgi:hypothetical protein